MIRYFCLALTAFIFIGCQKEKEGKQDTPTEAVLAFETQTYTKKSALPCNRDTCTYTSINVPIASGIPVVADSINNKIFNTVRGIVYFGEKPSDGKNYEEVMASFIASYDELVKKFPDEAIPWEAKINGTVAYKTDSIINIKINHYTFTGGAHGYEGDRSLLFNAKTGKSITRAQLFKDEKGFLAFAEKKFREKFNIPAGKNINSTGMMFENDKFVLPQNIFFTESGLLLYYNAYEIASYAEQQKELLLPYSKIDKYLKVK